MIFRAVAGLAIAATLLSWQAETFAHARSESYSNWQISDTGMSGVITVSAGEVMALVEPGNTRPLDAVFAAHVANTVSVHADSLPCSASPPDTLRAARGFVRVEIRFACGEADPTGLRYRALLDALPAHVHYARVFDGETFIAETLVTAHADSWSRDAGGGHSFTAFLGIGIRHILSGIDHIAFLAGMLLVAGGLSRSVAAVTGFTLGHSLSLAAAVLGYVQADGRLVEAFIGFTVALVAVEYFLPRKTRAVPLAAFAALFAWVTGGLALTLGLVAGKASVAYLGFGVFAFCYLVASSRLSAYTGPLSGTALFTATTCFGLIHGFGFAGFLMDTGALGGSLFVPLLGFNLGVELGQLGLLAVAFIAAYLFRGTRARRLAPAVAAGLSGLGVFWFVGRSLAF